jgi:hypothetical protein
LLVLSTFGLANSLLFSNSLSGVLIYTGIALSALKPRQVILSDFPSVVPLLNANIRLNVYSLSADNRIEEERHGLGTADESRPADHPPQYRSVGYCWGESSYTALAADDKPASIGTSCETLTLNIMDIFSQCEIGVASDVVYDPIGYSPLVQSINRFFEATTRSNAEKLIVMSHRHRNPEDFR